MKSRYVLHNYRRCPFCIRVRILLHLKGIEYEIIEEPLRQWTDWMKDWSESTGEKPRVPVLRRIDEEGAETIYTESNDINIMLDAQHVEVSFTPDSGSEEFHEMLAWFTWCDDIFKHQIDRFKYGENLQFDPVDHIEDTKVLREMVLKLEERLTDNDYLVANRLTLADIAIIPFVRQIMRTREGEFDFKDFPHTEAWTKNIISKDWFTDVVMKK